MNSLQDIKVSIVTPAYNSARFIVATIEAVRAQTHKNWEMLIVDDCSTDATSDLVEAIASQDFRIRLIKQSINTGAAESRNNAIRLAQGDYIAFIDSDDLWLPVKLEKQLAFMVRKDIQFSFTSYEIIDQAGILRGKIVDATSKTSVGYLDMLAKRATIGCSTVMLDRRRLGEIEMPLIRSGQDYGLWLKILKTGIKAHCLQCVLTRYRLVPGSISSDKLSKARRQWQIYRKYEMLNLTASFYYFVNYVYRAIFRK
jgi:teichuronic acid biosynthesis glycosyltransferase TuaG